MMRSPTVLLILDGFGFSKETQYNAIAQATTPTLDYLLKHYPHTLLEASDTSVGLPAGYMGNSQIGHRTIGAGRTIEQPLSIVNKGIKDNYLQSEKLDQLLHSLAKTGKTVHIMGLLSDAGVHSHLDHLKALLKNVQKAGIKKIIIHPFLDGRDTPPRSAHKYLDVLSQVIAAMPNVCIGSIIGRFYAMDRDENWDRTAQSYKALTQEGKQTFETYRQALDHFYAQRKSDEFIPPVHFDCFEPIQSGDGVIFFNFRPDRARQLTQAFVTTTFDHFKTEPISLAFFITPFPYSDKIKTDHLFEWPEISNTLKEVLLNTGKSVFSIAETEKYAHVTYFFAGANHKIGMAGTNILIPSITTENYAHYPCMQAQVITQAVISSLQYEPYDFYLINYANADMVGHSGDFNATVKAIECLDSEIKKLYTQLVEKMDGTLYITADHGNAENMYDQLLKQPKTAHTTNPVPFIMVQKRVMNQNVKLPLKTLADIAPFILQQMHIPIPKEMNQTN